MINIEKNIFLLLRSLSHVTQIAPNVQGFGSLYDEEQERELEQELEEECVALALTFSNGYS